MNTRTLSDQSRLKISNALKGHSVSDSTRKKISAAQKGVKSGPCSVLRRQKIAESRRPASGFGSLISPNGIKYTVNTITDFCVEHNLCISAVSELLRGKRKIHKGWQSI
jgi:hypothetical protein